MNKQNEDAADTIIQFDQVSFQYRMEDYETPITLFSELDMVVRRGEFLAVVGRNGSGKSTAAKLMNGLYVPSKGRVTVNGMDTADENHLLDIRRTVGLVFQNPDNQLVSSVVEEDVAFGPENLGLPPAEIRRRVDEALSTVQMSDYSRHDTHKLSGGQKQRVAIAGILAMRPQCIVLDEPTAMLDPRGRIDVLETVTRLNREAGITVVLVTHFMEETAGADRVLVMDEGRILYSGIPQVVFARPALLEQAGMQLPQSAQLVGRLRQQGVSLPADILTEQQCIDALERLFGQTP